VHTLLIAVISFGVWQLSSRSRDPDAIPPPHVLIIW